MSKNIIEDNRIRESINKLKNKLKDEFKSKSEKLRDMFEENIQSFDYQHQIYINDSYYYLQTN